MRAWSVSERREKCNGTAAGIEFGANIQMVSSVLSGDTIVAEAAGKEKVSEESACGWRAEFL